MSPCVICNAPIGINESRRRKTCSTKCARKNRQCKEKKHHKRDRLLRPEKYRLINKLRYARKRAARSEHSERSCRVCGTDISGRYGNARYCSDWCQQHKHKPKIEYTCRKCGEPVPLRRFVCDQCKSKYVKPNYVDNAKTFDERLARIERTKQSSRRHHVLVRAANQMYRELQGKTKKQPTTERQRAQHEYAVYVAMRELNLLPTKEDRP